MRIIICGVGRVGHSIASYLSREQDNDITLVDHDENLVLIEICLYLDQ